MSCLTVIRSTPIARSIRVQQLEGYFDLPPTEVATRAWTVDWPIDERPWSIGLITGPSGCGKSTLAREAFGDRLVTQYAWPETAAVIDAFPEPLGIKTITELLSSVGFSSPPSWLRPFGILSGGEQFRVTVARALAEAEANRDAGPIVLDEFTSLVDRSVARVASAALAKCVRRRGVRLVAVTCHDDVVDWLQPDWVLNPALAAFSWRSVQPRPGIAVAMERCASTTWAWFRGHHYLSADLAPSARCWMARVEGRPAVFVGVLPFAHPRRPGWREHRVVCLPDFQGVGLGNAVSEYVGSLFAATGKPYRSVTSNPAMIRHRARSPRWRMIRPPGFMAPQKMPSLRRACAATRITASFEYIGPTNAADAALFGLITPAGVAPSDRKSRNRPPHAHRR